MKPIRVNADYESELFFNQPGSPVINQTIEFLALYLEDRPLYSQKQYDPNYLDYVESLTGRKTQIVNNGAYENWWGPLKNLEAERWFNSKLTSTELILNQEWEEGIFILNSEADLKKIDLTKGYILKDPFGMSGQRIQKYQENLSLRYPVIAEPFRERKYDFGTYVFPDGKTIHYQNLVDDRFQYKGTIFKDWQDPCVENLPFYGELSSQEWDQFKAQLETIELYYQRFPNEIGYSIDSFVYRDRDQLKIRSLCEVNYRRTMGRVAYELCQKYALEKKKCHFCLRPQGTEMEGIKLAPQDSRFGIYLCFQ